MGLPHLVSQTVDDLLEHLHYFHLLRLGTTNQYRKLTLATFHLLHYLVHVLSCLIIGHDKEVSNFYPRQWVLCIVTGFLLL